MQLETGCAKLFQKFDQALIRYCIYKSSRFFWKIFKKSWNPRYFCRLIPYVILHSGQIFEFAGYEKFITGQIFEFAGYEKFIAGQILASAAYENFIGGQFFVRLGYENFIRRQNFNWAAL